MKRIFLPIIALAAVSLAVACEDLTKVDQSPVDPKVDVLLDGESVIDGLVSIEYENSVVLSFSCSGVSMVKAQMPQGWSAVTSMNKKTLTLIAPSYSDAQAEGSGEVKVLAYDGTGSYITRSIYVAAFECEAGCVIVDPVVGVANFTLGSKRWFVCDMTANIGDFAFTLPRGWGGQKTPTGFVITAPVYTPESGDEQDGTVGIVPVTYFGQAHEELTMTVDVHVDETATFQFSDPGRKTFAFGQTMELPVLCSGVASIDGYSAPQGWTVDYSRVLDEGILVVTAPSKEASAQGRGALELSATQSGIEKTITCEGDVVLRIYGLNDADDIKEFTAIYDNTSDSPETSYDLVSPYMVDGELCLNADITIPSECVAYGAYWLKRLVIPLNGDGHTLTVNTKQAERGGLFQNLGANVRNLHIAGRMEATAGSGKYVRMGSLASYVSRDGVIIENVSSSAELLTSNQVGETAIIGGLVGVTNNVINTPKTLVFKDCSFTGSITTVTSIEAVGGIMGQAANGIIMTMDNCTCSATINCSARGVKGIGGIIGGGGTSTNPGEIVKLNGCSFDGIIEYASDGNYDTRIGGLLGNLERGAELTGCSFTGTIHADMKSKAYFAGSSTRGIGGIIGRDTAPNAGYPNMNAKALITDCVSNGTIKVVNSGDTEADNLSHVGQIVGLQKNTSSSHVESGCTASSIITFEY